MHRTTTTPVAEPDQALLISADDETSRRARDALQAAGLDVCACTSADEALERLHGVLPRVVVIDDDLGDPAALCGELRRHAKCRYVPIVRLSGDDGREALHRAYDEGFTSVFVKPLSHEFLCARFRSYAQTGRTISGLNALHDGTGQVPHTIPDVFLELSSRGIVRRFLGGADEGSRWTRAAAEGASVDTLWPGDTASLIRREIRRALTTRESHTFEFAAGTEDAAGPFEMRLLVQGRDRLLAIIRDMAEFPLHGAGGAARPDDTLTGLTRREVFMHDLAAAIDDARLRERSFALMCIDLDDFSAINDSLGRPFGDTVLRVSSERLQRCLRSDDALTTIVDADDSGHVARSGSDEFVVMLPDIVSRQTAAAVAERIGTAFAEPIASAGSRVTVTPSIGLAVFPGDAADAETLLLAARSALDEARSNDDTGFAFYSDTQRLKTLSRPDGGDELRWAIDKQQLDIHYLPRIDLASGNVVALEGLLRWEHPLRGMVPSGEIVPLAEVTGLMSRIGEWVIHAACAHARRWRDETATAAAVSINLSPREFARPELGDILAASMSDNDLEAGRVQVELKETLLMRQPRAGSILAELERLGVAIVIDNFGMGHSSFLRLAEFPVNAIKIDRHFVQGMPAERRSADVCAAIIAAAQQLGFRVIAQGVETDLQLEQLKGMGCDEAQGFLYTQPVPSARVVAFLNGFGAQRDRAAAVELRPARRGSG